MAGDTNTTPFRLLDLPPELRLRIYEFAVTSTNSIQISGCCNKERQQIARPVLTRTFREARTEGLKLYYKCNDFEACYCRHMQDEGVLPFVRWLKAIGPEHRRNLRLTIHDKAILEGEGEEDVCMEEEGGAWNKVTELGGTIEYVTAEDEGPYKVTFPSEASE